MYIKKDIFGLLDPDTGDTMIDWLEDQFVAAGWTINKKVQITEPVTDMCNQAHPWVESSAARNPTDSREGSNLKIGKNSGYAGAGGTYSHGWQFYSFERDTVITQVTTQTGSSESYLYPINKIVGITDDLTAGFEVLYQGGDTRAVNISTGRSYRGLYLYIRNFGYNYGWNTITVPEFSTTISTELYVESPTGVHISFALQTFYRDLVAYSNSGFDTNLAVDAQPGTIDGVGGPFVGTMNMWLFGNCNFNLYIDDDFFYLISQSDVDSGLYHYSTAKPLLIGTIDKYGPWTGGRFMRDSTRTAVEYEGSWYCTDNTIVDQLELGENLTTPTLPTKYRNSNSQGIRLQPWRLFVNTSLTATPIWGAIGEIPLFYNSLTAETNGTQLIHGLDEYDVFTSGAWNSLNNWIIKTN